MRQRAPAKETPHIFEGRKPLYNPVPSVILPVKEKGTLLLDANKDYRREAVKKYKHITTYVAIFPVLGRSERRRKAPISWLTQRPGC